jgi:hypothetical protein
MLWIKVGKVILVLIGLTVACLVAASLSQKKAYEGAKEICDSVKQGMSVQQLTSLAEAHGGRIRSIDADTVLASTSGWSILCRCQINTKANEVVKAGGAMCID